MNLKNKPRKIKKISSKEFGDGVSFHKCVRLYVENIYFEEFTKFTKCVEMFSQKAYRAIFDSYKRQNAKYEIL